MKKAGSGTNRKMQRGGLAIHERMRDDILWLRIEPNSAIDEVSLAAQYGVSRTPVREAVARLASEGLVHHLPNRTSIVAPLVMRKLKALFDMYYLLSRAVVREAAAKISEQPASELKGETAELMKALRVSADEPSQKMELALRQKISTISDNFFRDNAYRVILDAGIRTKYLYLFPNCAQADRDILARNWQVLVEAICAGDVEASDHAVTAQIQFEAQVIERIFIAKEGYSMPITPPLAEAV
ncbi:GntR family transcriptional regulator [Hoeflea sp. AS60]|uniref:GntR family transcriptional regulator n=1 Tax=Hoeflea sp. AS60 TaxID=3135780 RepID=UPI003181DF7A